MSTREDTILKTTVTGSPYIDWRNVRRHLLDARRANPYTWTDLPLGFTPRNSVIRDRLGMGDLVEIRREPVGHSDDTRWLERTNGNCTNEFPSVYARRKYQTQKIEMANAKGKRVWLRLRPVDESLFTEEQVDRIARQRRILTKADEARTEDREKALARAAEHERRLTLTPGELAMEDALALPEHMQALPVRRAKILLGRERIAAIRAERAEHMALAIKRTEARMNEAFNPEIRRAAIEAHQARIEGHRPAHVDAAGTERPRQRMTRAEAIALHRERMREES